MAKRRVIDWRLRPPFGSFKLNKVYENMEDPRMPESAANFSMDLLVKEMDEAGVEIGMVPFRKGQDIADMAKLNELYPGRFYSMAHIDPYAEDPVKDIDDLIVNGPAKLAIVEPGQIFIKQPLHADDKLLYPIYEKCQKDNIVLTLTFGGLYSAGLEYYNPVYIDRVAREFPNLKMVLTHGGWPYVTEIMHVCYENSNVYLAPDCYFFPLQPGSRDYAIAASNLLQDQVVFGTAYPALSFQNAIDGYIACGLTDEKAQEKVFWSNAAKLLGVE